MAFSTFSGPIRSGTVRYGTGNNTGVAVLTQAADLGLTTSVACVLPAGAQILNIFIDVTTAFTASSIMSVGDGITTQTYVSNITSALAGRQTITFSAAQLSAMSNIGTTDVAVTVTMSGTTATQGAGFITVVYAQKASNGAQDPATP